jgi:L-lactate dehydrogenase complex protein LldG
MKTADLTEKFSESARNVAAVVNTAKTFQDALAYAVDICERKEACKLLISGCELPVSDKASDLCQEKQQKVVAAPGLSPENFKLLSELCAQKGLECIESGMRQRLAGVDVGITIAAKGIAETGTCVVDSGSEEIRLASMVCEINVVILPVSAIAATSFDLEAWMVEQLKSSPGYLAFITGPSRTADIERVSALGVHGPLELHVVLLEDSK